MPGLIVRERGWPAHFIGAHACRFKRNTLVELNAMRVVVSTIGLYRPKSEYLHVNPALKSYYETLPFYARKDNSYWDADTERPIQPNQSWFIATLDAQFLADDMHDNIVDEIKERMLQGEFDEGQTHFPE